MQIKEIETNEKILRRKHFLFHIWKHTVENSQISSEKPADAEMTRASWAELMAVQIKLGRVKHLKIAETNKHLALYKTLQTEEQT